MTTASATSIASCWSQNAPSKSIEVASLRCRGVLCSSARKIGPISKTRSTLEPAISCLNSCGLWFMKASSPKYVIGNSSVPPSVPVATIFGVLISVQSSSRNCSRAACWISARIAKIAWTSSLRRSSVRLSSRVESSASTFPDGSSGSSVSASATTSTASGVISTPVGARGSSSTAPVAEITLSRATLSPVSTRSSSISSFSNLI